MKWDLQGKRILVTRGERQATTFAKQIEAASGLAVVTPLIRIACKQDEREADIIHHLADYEWIFFTSVNGVRCFFEKVRQHAQEESLARMRYAVVGEKTNAVLKENGYEASFMPSTYNAATMAPDFLANYHGKGPMLIVHGQLSGTVLNQAFSENGIAFDCLEVYETKTNTSVQESLTKVLREGKMDVITFTSPSTVDAFVEMTPVYDWIKGVAVVCIGTTTEKRALAHGFTEIVVPDVFTIEGMIEVMHDDLAGKG